MLFALIAVQIQRESSASSADRPCRSRKAAPVQGGYAPPRRSRSTIGRYGRNMASALCYLFGWLTGVLFLVLEPYNKNRTVRFHAFQSIFLNVGIIAVWIVIGISALF